MDEQKTAITKEAKDELTFSAFLLDQAQYIMQDVMERFFELLNSDNSEDLVKIVWEFKRNRARCRTVFRCICDIAEEFERLGLTE